MVTEIPKKEYDREEFIKTWATKILHCEPNAVVIAAELLNQKRNFQTAVCMAFGLSVATHRQYILDAADYWSKNFAKDDKATVEYVAAFVQHYINEVQPYPADA